MAVSEPVIVWRGEVVTDAYGRERQSEPMPLEKTWRGDVAPSHPDEKAEVGRSSVITGYTIYVKGQGPTGVLPSDLIELPLRHPGETLAERRAGLLPVEGICAQWRSRLTGEHIGDQFAVKAVMG